LYARHVSSTAPSSKRNVSVTCGVVWCGAAVVNKLSLQLVFLDISLTSASFGKLIIQLFAHTV